MLCKVVNVASVAGVDKPRQAIDLCNLPLQFVEKEGLNLGTKIVVHIHSGSSSSSSSSSTYSSSVSTTNVGDNDILYTGLSYYKWSGDVSRRFPDCIEIQSSVMELEEIKMVRASVLHPTPREAVEVHVSPSTLYDWGKYVLVASLPSFLTRTHSLYLTSLHQLYQSIFYQKY